MPLNFCSPISLNLMASYILFVLYTFLTAFLSGAVFTDAKQSICGVEHLVQGKGIINSPNYPHSYPNSTNCTWTILSPPFSILTLVIKDLDIEDDQDCESPPCCMHNVLTLPLENKLTQQICGRNLTRKPIHLSQVETKIKFQASSSVSQSRGFLISFFIEIFHGGFCPPDQMRCSKNSNHCFITSNERCDGIDHCPNGEDEVRCDFEVITNDLTNEKVPYRDKCIHQSLWCDGNYACDVNSDQDTCLKNSVVSATIMGCLFCGLILVIAMMCGLRLYTNSSENGGNYRIQIPAHIASRLSLTRYISLPELIDDEFFHREPPPSYSIAVGQTNTTFEGLSSYSGRRGRCWRQRSTPIKPPTPPPSSDTSNQSSPSRDSITSSSYLSNDDNIRLVNTEQ